MMPAKLGSLMAVMAAAGLSMACVPTAAHKRACEMFVDIGGGKPIARATWIKVFNLPDTVKRRERLIAANEAIGKYVPRPSAEADADQAMARDQEAIAKARVSVSMRLAISLREVDEALKTCPDLPGVRW